MPSVCRSLLLLLRLPLTQAIPFCNFLLGFGNPSLQLGLLLGRHWNAVASAFFLFPLCHRYLVVDVVLSAWVFGAALRLTAELAQRSQLDKAWHQH